MLILHRYGTRTYEYKVVLVTLFSVIIKIINVIKCRFDRKWYIPSTSFYSGRFDSNRFEKKLFISI